jgi:hypothetical protein
MARVLKDRRKVKHQGIAGMLRTYDIEVNYEY